MEYIWYWNPIFSVARGLRRQDYDADMLKFIEDINAIVIELVDVYVEHSVDNPDIINEEELGNGYDEEVDIDVGVDEGEGINAGE